jgi:hypothetical protein
MRSLFRRRKAGSDQSPPEHPAQTLLAEFDALDAVAKERIARQFALLWSWFMDEFGGPHQFLDAPAFEQMAYLERLDLAAERSRARRATDLARYYYSAAILRQFLAALRSNDTSPAALALSDRLVWLTERGRRLEQSKDGAPGSDR